MFRMTTYLTAPALVMLMGGTAEAALTADQVWQSWKDAGALAGLTVSAATENKDGGALTLNGVSIAPPGATGLTISDMVLTEEADGSVTITPGASIGADLSGDGASGSLALTHDGLTLTAREGEAGGVVYDYEAAALNLAFDTSYSATSLDGTEAGTASSKGTIDFTNLAGSYSDTPGDNRTFGIALAATKLVYDLSSDDPGMQMKTASVSEVADVAIGIDVALPTTIALAALETPADFAQALREGMSFALSIEQGASSGSASQEDQLFPYQMTMNGGPSAATMLFDKDTFSIESKAEGLSLDMTSAALPVPVKFTSGPLAVGLTVPVLAKDVAGDYGLVWTMSQVSVNEEAWAMVDPGSALKRDPADLSIDVSGKVRMDVTELMAAEEAGITPTPPAPETLDITEMSLKIAGAAFAATGAFTFDNSAGMPEPIGKADVTLTGSSALIDGLIATGLITEEDAMGARMMMGAFMSPGAAADELTSTIEAKAGGEIYVNGQRIQ